MADAIHTGTDRLNPWLNRFAWFTVVATLLLICSGGMVEQKCWSGRSGLADDVRL